MRWFAIPAIVTSACVAVVWPAIEAALSAIRMSGGAL